MKKHYRNISGCTASISPTSDGQFRLRISLPSGKRFLDKKYKTERGAKIALGRWDTWKEL